VGEPGRGVMGIFESGRIGDSSLAALEQLILFLEMVIFSKKN
jgi:hypothetical protein